MDKSYLIGDKRWLNQKVITDFDQEMIIISEGQTDFNNHAKSDGIGGNLGWIDNNNIIFKTIEWTNIYNRISNSSIVLTPGKDIIFVKEISP